MVTKDWARVEEVEAEMEGLEKAPMRRRSGSSWMIWPGEGSALPMRETPERTGVVGCEVRKGFSMLRPFWMRTRVVCVLSSGRAGTTRSTTVGEMSGMFLVARRMKSYGGRFSWTILGMVLRTNGFCEYLHEG
jgi:hypothetical protein